MRGGLVPVASAIYMYVPAASAMYRRPPAFTRGVENRTDFKLHVKERT